MKKRRCPGSFSLRNRQRDVASYVKRRYQLHRWRVHSFRGHNSVSFNQHAAQTCCIRPQHHCWLGLSLLLTLLQSSRETAQEHTALLVAASQRYSAPRGTNRATSRPCARRLVMSANTPSPARPRQSRGRRRLVPAGGYRTTRLGLLCAVTKSFSLSYRVTSTTGPLCVVLLLAVSNHSPAVWFIQAASEIPVKCSP